MTDTNDMDTKLRRKNLRTAWNFVDELSNEDVLKLIAASKAEWGARWYREASK